MNKQHYRYLFVAMAVLAVVAVATGTFPVLQVDLVAGQGYDTTGGTTDGGTTGDTTGTTTGGTTGTTTGGTTGTTSGGGGGSSDGDPDAETQLRDENDLNDPLIGSAVPATFRVPNGTRTTITGSVEIQWAPSAGAGTGLLVQTGQEFPVSGLDATGEWVRLRIGNESAWVPRSSTTLPPPRVVNGF
ncbi:MAG: hypothetical protein AAF787_19520 [Chloroflexota bacterium]